MRTILDHYTADQLQAVLGIDKRTAVRLTQDPTARISLKNLAKLKPVFGYVPDPDPAAQLPEVTIEKLTSNRVKFTYHVGKRKKQLTMFIIKNPDTDTLADHLYFAELHRRTNKKQNPTFNSAWPQQIDSMYELKKFQKFLGEYYDKFVERLCPLLGPPIQSPEGTHSKTLPSGDTDSKTGGGPGSGEDLEAVEQEEEGT